MFKTTRAAFLNSAGRETSLARRRPNRNWIEKAD
jgi:hypothetical protein